MFIGHFAAGFAAKKISPKISLGTTFIACQLLDLIWPVLLLTGVEQAEVNPEHRATPIDFTHYPYSHSLLFVLMWSLLLGGMTYTFKRDRKSSLVVGLLVLSHWFLDFIVHRPDLPLVPNVGLYFGLGMWNAFWPAFILESVLFIGGLYFYFSATNAKNAKGKWIAIFLAAFLGIIHVMNMFGPPPPSIMAVAWAGNLMWIFVALAYWADGNREEV